MEASRDPWDHYMSHGSIKGPLRPLHVPWKQHGTLGTITLPMETTWDFGTITDPCQVLASAVFLLWQYMSSFVPRLSPPKDDDELFIVVVRGESLGTRLAHGHVTSHVVECAKATLIFSKIKKVHSDV